jgi:DnaJ like chaperone protein
MSIWGILLGAAAGLALVGPLGALVGGALGHNIIDRPLNKRKSTQALLCSKTGKSVERRQVAFTIAAIALSAKMARADGEATDAEFLAFRRLFHVEQNEEANVIRFWNLAKKSTDGFEVYARQVVDLFGINSPLLVDLLEALILIAATDPPLSRQEQQYLERVAHIFGLSSAHFTQIMKRHLNPSDEDPYHVLGLKPGVSLAQIRQAYREQARQTHPDSLYAQGVPPEFSRIAHLRMAALNAAYTTLTKKMRAQGSFS